MPQTYNRKEPNSTNSMNELGSTLPESLGKNKSLPTLVTFGLVGNFK